MTKDYYKDFSQCFLIRKREKYGEKISTLRPSFLQGKPQKEAFSLSIPPHVRHGTEIRVAMDDIGLIDVHLNVIVNIDPYLEEF